VSRSTSKHWFSALLFVGITLALIWLAIRADKAVDVTANKRHQLSDQTVSAVKALSGPIGITAVVGPNKSQRDALVELVSRYQQHNSAITLNFINPETNPEKVRELNASAGGELIIQGMGREQRLQSVSERALTGALRQLNREGERKLAFVIGHDERSIDSGSPDAWSQLVGRLGSIGFNSESLSLVSDPRIDESVNVLVLADPRRPYFPGEIASLLEYINLGGNLLWLIETDPNGKTGSGLKALALELGIEISPGIIIDTASQSANTGSPDFVILENFMQHPVTEGLSSPIVLPQVKALAVTPLAGQTLLPLLQTPEASWTETGVLEGAVGFDENTNEVRGPLVVGVTIERKIKDKMQRIAIIGDADFAADQFIGNGSNAAFSERLMMWLAGDTEALSFVTTAAPDASLALSSRSIIVISIALLFLLPLLLLCVSGYALWRKRR